MTKRLVPKTEIICHRYSQVNMPSLGFIYIQQGMSSFHCLRKARSMMVTKDDP